MKKVVSAYCLWVPSGNYFIEDILDIYELLDSVSSRVVISTEQFEFESLEEVKEYKRPIKEISLTAYDPYISIKIDTWVRVYSSEDTPLARGVVEKIADLAKRHVKPFNIKSRAPTFNMSTIIILAIIVLCPATGVYFFADNRPIIGSLLFGFVLFFVSWVIYATEIRKSTIKLIPKYEAPNFFKANSDKIFIAVIAAIVGVIIKFLIDKFLS
jgi:hypothetical protein